MDYSDLLPQNAYALVLHRENFLSENELNILQELACKAPYYAYIFARDIKGANIKYCQEAACREPKYAVHFAYSIENADIKYCQEAACRKPYCAYMFARDIKGADIKYCQKATINDIEIFKKFINTIPEADKNMVWFI